MAKFSFNFYGKFLDAILNFQNFYFIFILEMFKKMGRPSRKGTATAITLEDPNGDIMYFSIDNRGKANLLFATPKIKNAYMNQNVPELITPSSSSDNLFGMSHDKLNSSDSVEKPKRNKETKPIFKIEESKFDLFLEKINSRVDIDDFLRENRLSFHMLPPIIA